MYLLIKILQESHFFFSVFFFLLHLTTSACFAVCLLLCPLLFDSGTDSGCVNHGCGSSHRQSDHPITMNLTSMTMTLLSIPITMGLSSEPITINFVDSHHQSLLRVWFFIFVFNPTETNLINNSSIDVGHCSMNGNGIGFNQSRNRFPVSPR